MTPGKLYTIGKKDEQLLSELDEDVTISVLAEQESSADATLNRLLERYEEESDHITVKYVDPASQYRSGPDLQRRLRRTASW